MWEKCGGINRVGSNITYAHIVITWCSHGVSIAAVIWRQFPDQMSADAREVSPLHCEMTVLIGHYHIVPRKKGNVIMGVCLERGMLACGCY
jgi:hypothetical protein